jgi:hypothetical protein
MIPTLAAFTEAVEAALTTQNWVGALITALTLPDICGWLENPRTPSTQRYIAWFERFVGNRYTGEIGPSRTKHVFLSGSDCYALRCALLHEGSDQTTRQRAKQALSAFRFVVPRPGWAVHNNQVNATLQLQVDIFCRDVCAGVAVWQEAVLATSKDVQARTTELLTVEIMDDSVSL